MPSIVARDAKAKLIKEFFERDMNQLQKDYPSILEGSIPKKNFLYRQGDHCSDLFWIKSGIVKLSHLTEQGNEITIDILRRGDVIGYFLNDSAVQKTDETVQALDEVNYYRITYSDFKAMMFHQAELAWYVIEDMYARKQRVERKLRTILTHSVETRVITALLELAEMFGIRCTHGYTLEIHLTQQEVADLVGASRSVVSTVLNDFRSRGMLDYTREQICINDAALHNSCEFQHLITQ